jgi:cellulose synthase/poly-beta-1,6-N-acetylglucosamine synthase-like glycosyltransferase
MMIDFIAGFIALFMATPLLVVGCECLITLLFQEQPSPSFVQSNPNSTFLVLIPAHNEALLIANTLARLIANLGDPALIMVVADNCTDNTAMIARSYGVTVLERYHDTQRGKGFALDYGIQYLKQHTPPKVLIIMDADCWVEQGTLEFLCSRVIATGQPAQSLYMMELSLNAPIRQRIAGFAWLVKNKIRPLAVQKMGLPVTLTGTGMAFPWQVFEQISLANGNIAEDMQLGIDCVLHGFRPNLCSAVVVCSYFPQQQAAEKTQRTRWEHGHLMNILTQVPVLLKQGCLRQDWRLLGLALDISVPPLSLLVLLSTVGLLILAGLTPFIKSSAAFFILLWSAVFFALMLAKIWHRDGQYYLTFKELCNIPVYIVTKLSVYIAFIFKRQKKWVRTDRND